MADVITIDGAQYPIKPISFSTVRTWNLYKHQLTGGLYDKMNSSSDSATLIALDIVDFEVYMNVFLPELDLKKLFNNASGRISDLDLVDNYPKIYGILKQFRAILNPKIERILDFMNAQEKTEAKQSNDLSDFAESSE